MVKQNKGKKADSAAGKGKVTPVQIAFIVERYLADNNYTSTLSAFRTESNDLLSKTKGKEAPKGLLGLADILDQYISMKEQRLMVDQEKRRVEVAMQGIQEVFRAYNSTAGVTLPPPSPSLLSPQVVATPLAPSFPPRPSNGSPSDHTTIPGTTLMNYSKPPILPLKASRPNNFSTPITNFSSANKRNASKSAPKVPPPPKKSRIQPTIDSSVIEGKTSCSQVTSIDNTEQNNENFSAVQSANVNDLTLGSTVQGSSVAKSLFKQLPESRANSSSPKTPPQAFPSQADKSVPTSEDASHRYTADAAASREMASANCSIISSQTVIVSPLKGAGYYTVERSYHVTSSPLKFSPKKLGKREHVKGKLLFDEPDASMSLERLVATDCSTPSTNEETPGTFDYNLPDLDIFSGDISFSELLADIDLDCGGIFSTCQPDLVPSDFIPGPQHDEGNGCSEANQVLCDPCLPNVTRFLSKNDMNIQCPDSVTSVRTMTKRVKISSPAKPRRNCSLDQTTSPGVI